MALIRMRQILIQILTPYMVSRELQGMITEQRKENALRTSLGIKTKINKSLLKKWKILFFKGVWKAYTWLCSGLFPDSAIKNYSWQLSRVHTGWQILNPDRLYARQRIYPLYYFSLFSVMNSLVSIHFLQPMWFQDGDSLFL